MISCVCTPCGIRFGRAPMGGLAAIWYAGRCDLCGQDDYVTEPRDFGGLNLPPVWAGKPGQMRQYAVVFCARNHAGPQG